MSDAAFRSASEQARALPLGDASDAGRLARYGTSTHRDWLAAHEKRARMQRQMAGFFERFDVLLLPVVPVPAIPHDHSEPQLARTLGSGAGARPYFDVFRWIALATDLHLPASVAPVGRTRGGLPVGIQIVAPYLQDLTAIDFAGRLAEVGFGFEPPPGF